MHIALLALPGSMKSAIAGLSDMFWLANQVISQRPGLNTHADATAPCFTVKVITADGKPVVDAQGRWIESDGAFSHAETFDLVIASGMRLDADKFPVDFAAVKAGAAWVKHHYQQGSIVAGVCAGGFVLGEAGVLNGRMCTTTWWLFHTLRERYPAANPVWGKTLAEEGNVITTGGPLSWADLVIHIVRKKWGNEAARMTADMAVADSQPLSQHIYAPGGFLNSVHPLLIKAENIVRYQNIAISVEQLAAQLNMSSRTLHRKMGELSQETPKSFITRVRIENAAVLLEKPGKTLAQIASECGYSDETAFRRAFISVMGMSPGRYKEWIKQRSGLQQP
ncbi:GlxA family transcriptional regulator [Kosakonia radicincitans]|uniref:GlxA family transcriptional regulator n=1 Tax=Kosakonia radicincitans TaxID=283686 RepID=UPI0005C2B26D|nr:helix-turn-helix domain-containing protein [Kosakonia radicincitans]KIS45831.1 helix-turn-helix domain protein [Kosakonia radicincitans YD4]